MVWCCVHNQTPICLQFVVVHCWPRPGTENHPRVALCTLLVNAARQGIETHCTMTRTRGRASSPSLISSTQLWGWVPPGSWKSHAATPVTADTVLDGVASAWLALLMVSMYTLRVKRECDKDASSEELSRTGRTTNLISICYTRLQSFASVQMHEHKRA